MTNLEAAQALYRQTLAAGLDHGCLEVALTALGAQLTFQDLDRTTRTAQPLTEAIENRGFKVNWIVPVDKPLSRAFIGSDFTALLDGAVIEADDQDSECAGYLWFQYDLAEPDHVFAILPADATQSGHYQVMDTLAGGYHQFSADQLAHLANYILDHGGRFEIVQLTGTTAQPLLQI